MYVMFPVAVYLFVHFLLGIEGWQAGREGSKGSLKFPGIVILGHFLGSCMCQLVVTWYSRRPLFLLFSFSFVASPALLSLCLLCLRVPLLVG